MDIDFSILYFIQNLRTPALDSVWLFITNLAGSNGELWLLIGAALCIFKKTRKCGISLLISYAFVYLIGNLILKNLIARPRPCHIDETVQLLISRPSSYSCPSTHSAWAFGGATAIFMHHKKIGIPFFILAAMIAFSRMYLFVHFPSDVLFGVVLGIFFGFAGWYLVKSMAAAFNRKSAKSKQ